MPAWRGSRFFEMTARLATVSPAGKPSNRSPSPKT
jgi:hypothetical protein